MENQDIFDYIMKHFPFCLFMSIYIKYKEQLLYLFFGGLTTIISISSFIWVEKIIDLSVLVANVISWVLSVFFAYITNRTCVFKHAVTGCKGIFLEAVSFSGGRLFTLGMEEIILLIAVEFLNINSLLVKIIAQVLVFIGNYMISKFFVFRTSE